MSLQLGLRVGRRLRSLAVAWIQSADGRSFLGGGLASLYVVAFCHPAAARFGTGLTLLAGAATAVAVAIAIGGFAGSSSQKANGASRWLALVPAFWAVVFGALLGAVAHCGRWFDFATLAAPAAGYVIAFAASLVLFGIPTAYAIIAVAKQQRSSTKAEWILAGMGTGILATVYIAAPYFGVRACGWIAASISLIGVMVRLRRDSALNHAAEVRSSPAEGKATPAGVLFGARRREAIVIATGSLVIGALTAALARLTFQLFPSTEAEEWTAWAGFLAGAALSLAIGRRAAWGDRRAALGLTLVVTAMFAIAPVLLFGSLVDLFLSATSSVSQVWLLMLIRGAVAAAIFCPLGAAWSALVGMAGSPQGDCLADESQRFDRQGARLTVFLQTVPALLGGCLLARWSVASGLGTAITIGGGAVLLAVFGAAIGHRWATTNSRRFAWTFLLLIMVAAGAGSRFGTYDAARAARLLFSTNVFMARHEGTESRLLPFLDDSRLIAVREGDRGTYTLWKQRGVQLHLRESGIPKGALSTQPQICPQFSGEVVPAALPLALHERPRRVLVLGLGTGTAIATCLDFPIESVTCLEGDRGLITLVKDQIWSTLVSNPQADNRLRLIGVDPAVGVQARAGSFDVILSNAAQAGTSGGTAYFTHEFYRGISRQLAADGIFAQRFQQIDFGPWPMKSILATLQSAFDEVAAVEAGPGELVLLASNSDRGLARPGILQRFQSPQVSRTFAQLGWDWSIALNLGAFSGEPCADLVKDSPGVNTAWNGRFAFRLPQEIMRWGPKAQELGLGLAPHAGRIAQWPNVDGNDPELLRRLSNVVTQRTLMTDYPDQPWTYRKIVREELQKHPHTVIKSKADGLDRAFDAFDQRRLDYFAALGKAARTEHPTREAIEDVEEFAEPYDPIVSYFLHHELAAIYARAGLADSSAQLGHRLHAVYFSDTRDKSIRDVVDALGLLARNSPSLDAAQRWDHMNALLDYLKIRWSSRGLGKPASIPIALNDLEKSIRAAETAFGEMERIRAQAGVKAVDWTARHDVLEQSLIRPLRSYRDELVTAHMSETKAANSHGPIASKGRTNAN